MNFYAFGLCTLLLLNAVTLSAQFTSFEEKIYPAILREDSTFTAAVALGRSSSPEAIQAFEALMKRYDLDNYPHANVALQYLLGASYHPYDQQRALELYRKAADGAEEYPELYSRLLTRQAWAMVQLKHPKAADMGRRAYTCTKDKDYSTSEQLNALTHFFSALHGEGDLLSCFALLDDYEQLIDSAKSPGVKHTALSELGRFYFMNGDYAKAMDYVVRDVDLSRQAFGDTSLMTANAYMTVGIVASGMEDSEKEVQYYEKSLQILDELISPKRYHHYTVYYNLGAAYHNLGAYETALSYYRKSRQIQEKLWPQGNPKRSELYGSIAVTFARLNMADSVKRYTGLIESIYQQGSDMLQLPAYFSAGKSLKMIGEDEAGEDFHNELIELIDSQFNGYHFYKGQVRITEGESLMKEGHYLKAIGKLQKAIVAVHPQFEPEDSLDLPDNLQFSDPLTASRAIYFKCFALERAIRKDATLKELNILREHINFSISLLDVIQSQQFSDATLRTNTTARQIFALGIENAAQLHAVTGDQKYLEEAFGYFQQSKGTLLEAYLKEKQTLSDDSSVLTQKIEALKEERFFVKQQMARTSKEEKAVLNARLAEISEELQNLWTQLKDEQPAYFQYLEKPNNITFADIQQVTANRDAAYVEYLLVDSTLYAFVNSDDVPIVKYWTIDSTTEDIANLVLDSMSNLSAADFAGYGYQLYSQLLAPIAGFISKENLVLVPDAWMAKLPFELLVTEQVKDDAGFNELKFLLADYNFSYLYAADMLHQWKEESSQKPAFYLGLAPGFAGDEGQLAQVFRSDDEQLALAGARQEVNAAASIFDEQVVKADANLESFLKTYGKDYQIIHLATHADVDEENPLNSRIYLGSVSSEDSEDGILHQYELFNLHLDNDLTVLSACKTGYGPWMEGEGINSLARGFIYAGSKSIVLSNWDVHDQTSSKLMRFFFENLETGMGKSEALRTAKMQYLKKADAYTANPFYWAGFVLVGDQQPLERSESASPYWWLVVGFFVVLVVGGIWQYRRKASTHA